MGSAISRLTAALVVVAALATGANAGPYVDSVLTDDPVGYWRLEEGSGTAVDSSAIAGSQDGTYITGVGTITGAIVSEAQNTAADFNGTNGYVNVNDPTGVLGTDVNLSAWSIELWVLNQEAIGQSQNPVAKGAHFITQVTFFNKDSPNMTFGIKSGAAGTVAVPDPAVGVWTHLVGIIQANGANTDTSVYVNGILTASGIISGKPDPTMTTQPLTIGALLLFPNVAGNFFTGAVDEVAVYDYALGADRISAHFDAATASVPEPTALALLALSIGVLMRRRKRAA